MPETRTGHDSILEEVDEKAQREYVPAVLR